jgi:hypothetical protein
MLVHRFARAAPSRRFREFVGEPLMTFLKIWRMSLTADLSCRLHQHANAYSGGKRRFGSTGSLELKSRLALGVRQNR